MKIEVLPLIERAVSDALRAAWRDRDAGGEIGRVAGGEGETAEEFGGQGSWQEWEATFSGGVELDGGTVGRW